MVVVAVAESLVGSVSVCVASAVAVLVRVPRVAVLTPTMMVKYRLVKH